MKFLGVLDKVLDRVVLIFLLVLGLYVGYSIYDIWLLNHEASISAGLVEYKPVKEDGTIIICMVIICLGVLRNF